MAEADTSDPLGLVCVGLFGIPQLLFDKSGTADGACGDPVRAACARETDPTISLQTSRSCRDALLQASCTAAACMGRIMQRRSWFHITAVLHRMALPSTTTS